MQHLFVGIKFVSHDTVNIAFQEFFDSKAENFYKDGIMKLLFKWRDVVENNGAHIFN